MIIYKPVKNKTYDLKFSYLRKALKGPRVITAPTCPVSELTLWYCNSQSLFPQ